MNSNSTVKVSESIILQEEVIIFLELSKTAQKGQRMRSVQEGWSETLIYYGTGSHNLLEVKVFVVRWVNSVHDLLFLDVELKI